MLDHSFRRQLLMDGSYGSLVFVATQSDVLQRSEVISSLKLPRETSLTDCARARCKFVSTQATVPVLVTFGSILTACL